MRMFTLLFCIYLLALSVVPCSDTFMAGQSDKESITFSASHNHTSDNTDFCSPFCICNCCSSPVMSKFKASYTTFTKITFVSQLDFPVRELSFISKYAGVIWNPPQIIT